MLRKVLIIQSVSIRVSRWQERAGCTIWMGRDVPLSDLFGSSVGRQVFFHFSGHSSPLVGSIILYQHQDNFVLLDRTLSTSGVHGFRFAILFYI